MSVDGETGTYILDSGAPSLVLNREVTLSTATFSAVGNDRLPAVEAKVDRAILGPLKAQDIQAWEIDLSYVEEQLDRSISGLLGADALGHHDILINFESQEIIFLSEDVSQQGIFSPTAQVMVLPFELYHDNLPVVEVMIDGEKRKMAFDTGAGVNVLHCDRGDDTITLRSISHNNLRIKDAQFVSADLGGLQDSSDRVLDGILSATSLNAQSMVISFKRSTIYLFYERSLASL